MAENKFIGWGKVTLSPNVLQQDIEEGNWRPQSVVDHTPEFVAFINSMINNGFIGKTEYYPFEVYKAQAMKWLEDNIDPYNTDNPDYAIESELSRIDSNTFYFAEKYAFIKEGSDDSGILKYRSKEHNALLYYLIDCGYCLLIGKPRQIWYTTTVGIFVVKRLITRANYYMKFVTVSEDKGIEILRDKFKFPFQNLPEWMKCGVISDSLSVFHLGEKIDKGTVELPNSRCETVAPSPTAINGGSPQMTLIDEIGEVPDLVEILFETRPTLFTDTKQDGNLKLARQILCWGTGVSSNTGKRAFQRFWNSTLKLWDSGEYRSSIFVPVFISWHCRCNPEIYASEYKAYMAGASDSTKELTSENDRSSLFNMHYPARPIDMFGMSSNRLVSKSIIETGLKKIRDLSELQKPIFGYFEPIYDLQSPLESAYTAYKIIGATFVPCTESDDKMSCCMIKRPDPMWRNRYYQGTDPLLHETGVSLHASTIWDCNIPVKDKESNDTFTEAPICFINHRRQYDPKESFLQMMLMGIYYDTDHVAGVKQGVPEVIENNLGISYKEFKEFYGFGKNIVMNSELYDPELQGGGSRWGINTSGQGMNRRKAKVVEVLKDLTSNYCQNIYYKVFFEQLDTYVSVVKSNVVWQPLDKSQYRDDVLDATAFARICSLSYTHKKSQIVDESVETKKVVMEYKYDRNWNLVLMPVTK